MIKPHTPLIVCATPGTGSGLLCDALWNTGLAGRPDEYSCPTDEPTEDFVRLYRERAEKPNSQYKFSGTL